MENTDQAPANRGNTAGWLLELPEDYQDINEGVIKDMMKLTLRYFEQLRIAAARYQDVPSVLEVLELHKRFSLWTDGNSDLDRRLSDDPAVRKLIVSHLAALVIHLSTGSSHCSTFKSVLTLTLEIGINFFEPENRRTLVEETNRVLEQASELASELTHSRQEQSTSRPSLDILAFCDSIRHVEPRIKNLYTLLPTTRHLPENFDEKEPRQVEESGFGEGEPLPNSLIKGVRQRLRQSSRRMRSAIIPASQSSNTSHSGKNSRRLRSSRSNFNTKQSSDSKNSPSTFHPLSQDDSHGSARPVTDTNTSKSPSEVTECSSESKTSNLTGASSSCKRCRTIFSNSAGLK